MPQPQFVFDRFGRVLRQELTGLGDTALTMGKNMVMQPAAGYAGLLDLARTFSLDSAVNTIKDTEGLAGGPSTREGMRNLQAVGDAMGLITEPLQRGVDVVGEYSPAGGAVLMGAGAALDLTKLGRAGKLGKAAKAGESAERATTGIFGDYSPTAIPAVEQGPVLRYEPARGVSGRVARLTENKDAMNRAAVMMSNGMTEDGLGWYNMEPLRQQFVGRLGEEQGTKQFNQYIDLMAATSAGARTNSNARIASYYYVNGNEGAPVPIPPIGSGYGHKAQNLHNKNANEILSGGGLDPIQHPKRFTFAENLKGNLEPVTVDKHNVRAWGIASRDPEFIDIRLEDTKGAGAPDWWDAQKYGEWSPADFNPRQFVADNGVKWDDVPPTWFAGAPKANEYAALERLNQTLSDRMGAMPAQGQAALWLGAGPQTGLGSPPMSMMNTFDQLLQQRAAARKQTPTEVLDEFIRKKRALMLPVAGAGAAYGLLSSQEQPTD
jgi:hypothetical protein